jgi:ESF2/ABP1 family protein
MTARRSNSGRNGKMKKPERDANEDNTGIASSTSTTSKPKPASSLTKSRKNKTGVIYLSSLPPYLKPSALKSMLVARGFEPINRIFLTPYVPPSSRHTGAAPVKRNRRRMYTDGWVEFKSKRTAKLCAETLNATIVGGKKGGWYHDDIWNMKYLRGFKWDDLMEQVQRERREAEPRRRIEDAKAKKEEKVFIAGVERGKVVEGIRKKREEKERKRERPESAGDGDVLETKKLRNVQRVFRQNEVKDKNKKQGGTIDPEVRRVLGKIF